MAHDNNSNVTTLPVSGEAIRSAMMKLMAKAREYQKVSDDQLLYKMSEALTKNLEAIIRGQLDSSDISIFMSLVVDVERSLKVLDSDRKFAMEEARRLGKTNTELLAENARLRSTEYPDIEKLREEMLMLRTEFQGVLKELQDRKTELADLIVRHEQVKNSLASGTTAIEFTSLHATAVCVALKKTGDQLATLATHDRKRNASIEDGVLHVVRDQLRIITDDMKELNENSALFDDAFVANQKAQHVARISGDSVQLRNLEEHKSKLDALKMQLMPLRRPLSDRQTELRNVLSVAEKLREYE
ncbi:MAG: hypothetical protein WCJ29_05940, partial [bacterium]